MNSHPCPVCHRTASPVKGRPCAQCRDEQLERNRHSRRTVGYGMPFGHVWQRLEMSPDKLRRMDQDRAG